MDEIKRIIKENGHISCHINKLVKLAEEKGYTKKEVMVQVENILRNGDGYEYQDTICLI